jgi:phage shock protein A
MERFDHLQNQVDNLEARVRSYEVGGTAASAWNEVAAEAADPAIEAELQKMKDRLSGKPAKADKAEATSEEHGA